MSEEKIGLFTGSFDPLTRGHLDIIKRASKLFDKLYVGIFTNDSKKPMFTTNKRQDMLYEATKEMTNVQIIVHESDLTVNIGKKLGVTSLIRSIRGASDLDYEASMDFFNYELADMETIYLLARPEFQYISSSRVKEIYNFSGDYTPYVPKFVAKEMEKLRE